MFKQLHFKSWMLALILIIGGGNLTVSAVEKTVTVTIKSFTGLPSTAKYATYDWTADGVSGKGTIYGGESSTNMQMNGTNRLIYSTTAIPGTIKSVKLTKASGTDRSFQVYGRTTAYNGTDTNYGTEIGDAQSVTTNGVTFTAAEGTSFTYFVVRLNASNAAYLSSVVVTYEEESSSAVATSISINDANITNTDVFVNTAAGNLSATVKDAEENVIEGASVTWSSSNETVATIGEETGVVTLVGAGSTTITATYAGVKDTYKAATATYELEVTTSNPIVTFNLSNALFDIASVGNNADEHSTVVNGITITVGCKSNATSKTYYDVDHIRLYDDSYLKLEAPEGYAIIGVNLNRYKSGNWNGDKVTPTSGSFVAAESSTASLVWSGQATSLTFNYSGQCRTASVDVTLGLLLNVGSANWVTFAPVKSVSFNENYSTYIVTGATTTSATLAAVSAVPAGTPVLVCAEEGTYALPMIADASCDNVTGNKLQVSDGTIKGNESTIYALGVQQNGEQKGKVGFMLVADGVEIPAGKCYLQIPAGARSFLSLGGGEDTAIKSVATDVNEGTVYDLQGRRVSGVKQGLYIVNGKKVVLK